jgi:hypothetical protein
LRKLKTYLSVLLIICLSWKAEAQTLTYSFTDPCTKAITLFSIPATGTVIYFQGQSKSFTSADIQNGTFASWINQVYTNYRKIAPCGQQQGQVTQNQITSQIISNTVQSVVSSIMSQAQSAASSTITGVATSSSTANASLAGGDDAASKNNKNNDSKQKKKGNNNTNTNNQNNKSSSSNSNNTNGNTQNNSTSSSNSSNNTGENTQNNNTSSSNSSNNNGGNSSSGSTSNTSTGQTTNQTNTRTEQKGKEVVSTVTMNIDQQNQNSSKDDNSSSGGGKSKNGKSGSTNPLIVSSDFTTAQNLDKSFTPILNLSMSQSSMTGMSSWGLTSMIWFNFKQFALSGKYTKISFSKDGKLKWIHNVNLTGVYSYGNIIGFLGYSGILNAGKWGVTGFNVSGAMTLVTGEEKNTFLSPSITAFYTKPFKGNKRLTISPELYLISSPLIYSTKEKVTTTDRTFSAFIGSGFDYQITRRFKLNINYKANLSTNPEFPILSFFLIGSKINL